MAKQARTKRVQNPSLGEESESIADSGEPAILAGNKQQQTFPKIRGCSKLKLESAGAERQLGNEKVKFEVLKELQHRGRGAVLVRIYKTKNPHQPFYVYWRPRIDGKKRQRTKDFAIYSEALKFAEQKVTELVNNQPTLSARQAEDADAAFKRLQTHYETTGRRFNLSDVVGQFCRADTALTGRLLSDAVTGYLSGAATVKRIGIKLAVEQFIAKDEPKTKPKAPGERAELGRGYLSQKSWHLTKLANLFPGYSVCDLSKEKINQFFQELPNLPQRQKNALKPNSPKSRNHHRGALREFFAWAIKNDYLPANHRLNEADSMESERNGDRKIEVYTPGELQQLLEGADERLQPCLAIAGLAGVRIAEIMRMNWSHIWRVPGHIEIPSGVAKTRRARLVEMPDSLAAWLAPYRHKTGKLWLLDESKFQDAVLALHKELKIKRRHNALRHGYCSALYAITKNENHVAAMAGNSPAMVHGHYRTPMTEEQGKSWFAVRPKTADNVIPMEGKVAQ